MKRVNLWIDSLLNRYQRIKAENKSNMATVLVQLSVSNICVFGILLCVVICPNIYNFSDYL